MKFLLSQEKTFIKKFLGWFFIGLFMFYVIIFILSITGGIRSGGYWISGPFSDLVTLIMYIFFGIPLLFSAIYFFRSFYAVFKGNRELLKLGVLIVILGLIIGAGVCFSNLMMGSVPSIV